MFLILFKIFGSHLHKGFGWQNSHVHLSYGGRIRVCGLRIQDIQIDDVIPDRVPTDQGSYSLTAEYSKK